MTRSAGIALAAAIARVIACAAALPWAAVAQAPDGGAEAAAVARLLDAAVSGDETAAAKAADAVVAIGTPAARRLCVDAPNRPAPARRWALTVLRLMQYADAASFAASETTSPDATVRAAAVETLSALSGAASIGAYVVAARDRDVLVRHRAFDALAEHAEGRAEAVDAAVAALTDADGWILCAAIRILERAPAPKPPGRDPLPATVARVADRLAPGAAAPLFAMLERRAGAGAEPAIGRALRAARAEVVVAALESVARLGLKTLSPEVKDLARADDPAVACAAAGCLGRLGDWAALWPLIDLLERAEEPRRREAAVVALRKLTGKLHGYDVRAWRRLAETAPAR